MTAPPPSVLLPPRRTGRVATLAVWFLAVNALIVLATIASGLGASAALGASRGARSFMAWCGIG